MGNMVPTALSQIIEQIFNAIFSVALAKVLFDRGLIANLIYETNEFEFAYGARGGAIGTGVGAFAALVFLIFLFLNYFSHYKRYLNNNNGFEEETYSNIAFSMFSIILPIVVSTTIFNISEIVDDVIFSNAYALLNKNDEIIYTWGIYGNYHLLFNIPVAMANSLDGGQGANQHFRGTQLHLFRQSGDWGEENQQSMYVENGCGNAQLPAQEPEPGGGRHG